MSAYRSIDRSVASLGAPVRTHERKPIMGPGPLVLALLASGLTWYGAMDHEKLELSAWLMTSLAIVAAVVYAYDLYRTRIASGIVVHENGLLLAGISPRVLPWDDVTGVTFERKSRTKHRSMAFIPLPGVAAVHYSSETEYYWLCRIVVGKRVVAEVSDQYTESADLVQTLRSVISQREVPRALEALESGRSVELGPVTMSPARIEVAGDALPWSEVGSVQTDGAHLAVFDQTGEPRLRVRMERVQNPHVVMEVAESFRQRPQLA